MAVEVKELYKSRGFDASNYTLGIGVYFEDNDTAATITAAVKAWADPSIIIDYAEDIVFYRQDPPSIDEWEGARDDLGRRYTTGRVVYAKPDSSSSGGSDPLPAAFGFQIGTQSVKTVRSLKSYVKGVTAFPAATADDVSNLIGVTVTSGITKIEGADALVPTYTFTQTYFNVDGRKVTTEYLRDMLNYVGCVNTVKFAGHNAGEVLCTGLSGAPNNRSMTGLWTLQSTFMVQRNRSHVFTGGIDTVDADGNPVPVKGWQYVWSIFVSAAKAETVEGVTTQIKVLRPRSMYVADIYYESDLRYIDPKYWEPGKADHPDAVPEDPDPTPLAVSAYNMVLGA